MERLSAIGGKIKDLVSVNLTVSSMADYGTVNAEYVRRFGVNPPVRVCVQAGLIFVHTAFYIFAHHSRCLNVLLKNSLSAVMISVSLL